MATKLWFTDPSFKPPPNEKDGRLGSIAVPVSMFTDESTANDDHPRPRYNYPQSYEKMYLTQPPCAVVWPVHYVWSGDTNQPHQIVRQEEGIRMQDMVEVIRSLGQNFKCWALE